MEGTDIDAARMDLLNLLYSSMVNSVALIFLVGCLMMASYAVPRIVVPLIPAAMVAGRLVHS